MNQPLELLKIRDVARKTSLHRATIYRLIKRDEFPRPLKLSPGRVGWREDEISDWITRQQR